MGLKGKLKKASQIAAAPVRGALQGATDVGYLPTKKTLSGALRGDKSDIAIVGATAALAAVPYAGRAPRAARLVSRSEAGWIRATQGASAVKLRFGAGSFPGEAALAQTSLTSSRSRNVPGKGFYELTLRAGKSPKSVEGQFLRRVGNVSMKEVGREFEAVTRGIKARGIDTVEFTPVSSSRTRMFTGLLESKGLKTKASAPLISRIKTAAQGERGSLDTDKYLDLVRKRFRTSKIPEGVASPIETAIRASKAVPEGHVMAVAARGKTGVTGLVAGAVDVPDTKVRGFASAALSQTKMVRRKSGLLRGFYEKIKDESGLLNFPDRQPDKIRRIKAKVMSAIRSPEPAPSVAKGRIKSSASELRSMEAELTSGGRVTIDRQIELMRRVIKSKPDRVISHVPKKPKGR